MENRRSVRLFFLAALLVLATPSTLSAYLDPGSGSYLLQALIAGILGGSVAIKTFWKQIRAYFSGSNSSEKE